ncbi:hypothetical protein GCM10023221_32740 [Luteimicrobium xylanilyticum]
MAAGASGVSKDTGGSFGGAASEGCDDDARWGPSSGGMPGAPTRRHGAQTLGCPWAMVPRFQQDGPDDEHRGCGSCIAARLLPLDVVRPGRPPRAGDLVPATLPSGCFGVVTARGRAGNTPAPHVRGR